MAIKHYIKVTSLNHVLELHSFDESADLPSGLTEVASSPHEFKSTMDPNHIMIWTEEDGFGSVDVESDEAITALGITIINEAPTAIALSATAINENDAGAVVGTLTTTDADSGDTHIYSLSGTDASSFEVVSGQLKLKSSVSADYEVKSSYAVTVTATDSGRATFSQSFTVTVNDVAEE